MEDVWEELAVRDDQVPVYYVDTGAWPNVRLRVDAPLSAHYGLEVARRLKAAMEEQDNLSQRALGRRASIGQGTIGRILRGEVLPDLGTLARLEAALGVDVYPARYYQQLSGQHTPPTDPQ